MTDLRALVAKVQEADSEHRRIAYNLRSEEESSEDSAWVAKQDARRELRDAIYATTGVSIDTLSSLCQG